MYKICRTEQSTRRQRELENALLQLMCKRRYEDITVSDLCTTMQIPRKSFYRYFASKDGALYALIDHTLGDFYVSDFYGGMAKAGAEIDLERFFAFWYEKRTLLDALSASGLSGILMQRANSFAMGEGHMPRQFKRLEPEMREAAMAFAVSGLMSMILQWHSQKFRISSKEMSRLAISMLTHPLISK